MRAGRQARVGSEQLGDRIAGLVRALGLHQPERTPCGQPISVSEAHALMELDRDGSLGQTELARRLRLEKSTVSRLVSQLAGRGWLEREPSAADGRAIILRLSPAGLAAAARLAAARKQKFDALLAAIPEEERAGVLHVLDTLTEALHDRD